MDSSPSSPRGPHAEQPAGDLPPPRAPDPAAGGAIESLPGAVAVREELRRLGYLSHRLDRALLQDALRPQHGPAALARLALRVGWMAGLPAAGANALALAAANDLLARAPLDVLVLTAHLAVPAIALLAAATFLLCLLLSLVLRLRPGRRIEPVSLTLATVAGLSAVGGVAWRARDLALAASPPARWLLLAVVPLLAWGLIRLLYDALLALAVRLTAAPPRERFGFGGRFVAGAVGAVAVGALVVAALLPRGAVATPTPAFFPSRAGEPVLLVGLDGVLPAELDYLLAGGELPVLARLLAEGGVMATYGRDPAQPVAAFWTTVATGLPSAAHGVASFASYRPLGASVPLGRLGPSAGYWSRVAVPLGLCEYLPVLASRRRAWAFWELAARGGQPALAVNWWSTYPAEPIAGATIAHGAFQLIPADPEAALAAAPALAAEVVALRHETAGVPLAGPLASLPPDAARDVAERAVLPDAFYRAAAERLSTVLAPQAVAVYLPALDLAADGWPGSDVAFADLVRAEMRAADRLLGDLAPGRGTIAVVIDAGRRAAGEGRLVVWRAGGECAAGPEGEPANAAILSADPESLAAGLLAALGLPASDELSPPPALCPWPNPPATLPSFGERPSGGSTAAEGEEYLKNLESLGYL